jgi:hypothetical protein
MSGNTRLIRFREKHGDRVFVYSTGLEKQLILAQVAQERLEDGTWYDTDNGSEQVDLLRPTAHLSDAERVGGLLEGLFDPSKRTSASRAYKLGEITYYLGQIERWMQARRGYEYEDWDEVVVNSCNLRESNGVVRILDDEGEP